jgi:hypothetical protein
VNSNLFERFADERAIERMAWERVSRERSSAELRLGSRAQHQVFDDRPERARSGTEGWKVAAASTAQRQYSEVSTFKAPPYSDAWDVPGDKARMRSGFFPSPLWAGGDVDPPAADQVPEVRRDGPVFGRGDNFYGNYFGWGGSNDYSVSPTSPVDLAAWYHDMEYGAIQDKYGANEDPLKAYWESFTRFDQPDFMYDLAMSDLRFNENSWTFIGQGMDQGFYRGAPDLLAADILMASVAWVFHSTLATVRLGVYSAQVVFGGFYKFVTGEMSLGNYLGSIVEAGAKSLAAAGYFVAGTVRGLWSFGSATLRGIARDPARGLSGAAIGGAVGSIFFGPVGGAVGAIIGGAIGGSGGGCFITTAVCEAHGLPDDHELLNEFRRFRDNYMASDATSRSMVELYYRISPLIVAELARRPDKERIYRHLLARYLTPAFDNIRRGRYRLALRLYVNMLIEAATMGRLRHLIDRLPPVDRYRSLPDWDPTTQLS